MAAKKTITSNQNFICIDKKEITKYIQKTKAHLKHNTHQNDKFFLSLTLPPEPHPLQFLN